MQQALRASSLLPRGLVVNGVAGGGEGTLTAVRPAGTTRARVLDA